MVRKKEIDTTENILTAKEYSKLLNDIRDLIESGIDQPGKDNISQLTITYWKIGERINKEALSTKSGYHNSILKDLGSELELERTTLSRCLNFFKTYKSPPKNENLSWSHYRELMTIKNDKVRKELEEKAKNENWSRERLIAAIRQYQNSGDTENNKLKRPVEATYIYKAKILEVIDGDTLMVNLDLGFQVWKEQRIRLANINSKESYLKEGQDAYTFLRDKLATIDFVMIQTRKIDIYGRYVGHIFYDPNPNQNKMDKDQIFKNGIYLNEEIVREGFAEVL